MDSPVSQGLAGAAAAVASSKAKKMKMAIGSPPRSSDVFKPFAELSESGECLIKALVCRAWVTKNPFGKYLGTEYILADEQGSAMHCIARSSIAHCVVPKLQVGRIYSIGRFNVAPNKETYRLRRDDAFLLQLEGNTVIKELDCSSDGFVRHPFQLMDIDSITFNGNKFLIDVIGRVVNLGTVNQATNGSQYIDLHLINERGKSIRVTLWGTLCNEISARIAEPNDVYVIILLALSVRDYKLGIQLSSTSATSILDTLEIPQIAAMQKLMSETPPPLPDNIGTLLQLLHLGREQRDNRNLPSQTMICTVKIVGIRPQNSWNYYSCGLGGCKKGVTPHADYFWCESCENRCEFPLLRFRLHLDIADSSTSVVATLFDETTEMIIKKPAKAVLESLGETAVDNELPNDILRLVGTTHVFEFKTHTYYNHGRYESFTVSRNLHYLLQDHATSERRAKSDPENGLKNVESLNEALIDDVPVEEGIPGASVDVQAVNDAAVFGDSSTTTAKRKLADDSSII